MAEQAFTPDPRTGFSPSPAASTSWASALSGAAGRLPSYLCLLAQVALTTRAIDGRAARVVDVGPSPDGWRQALRSAAKVIGDHADVELDLQCPAEFRLRPGDPPLGCVAVDLSHAPAVRRARQLLARPPTALLPQVLVAVRPLAPRRGPVTAGHPQMVALDPALRDRMLRPDAMPPWSAADGDGGAERLFVLDVPSHPAHPAAHPEDELSARRRRRALAAR
jgi:hypothetical protein